ncbi:MAG: DNA-3-methyladenine glycosylase I [Rhodospirillales bacterium]|nr:DNA-3-methyladenine glycosylase I [Rhodospirillales bacterium]MCW8861498.1 DNA-3-methyladenine glycosylase I [Rhodospirillales bacterium]MCW8951752.1 DNA-3-methyladenine glycosylase I [Rhodospirillales bacterium]MCW8970831.1 DNA-3-methyladenine glycosylase I [Rhodospirillales bacterium]MCW9003601.1 DNA-3-methyladenine glycosylase I [Rhodospirillales bacterium]
MSWYCDVAKDHPYHGPYHDLEYGFPLSDDRALFERLCLEIFQAGLSWLIVLKKREAFVDAFDGFAPDVVAAYGERDIARLLDNPGIIRNKRKIAAIVENAARVEKLRAAHGSFAAWIAAHHPLRKDEWVALFRKTFVFMGPEVVNEFLMSIGYLPGTHEETCPVYAIIAAQNPPWMAVGKAFYDASD